jgi:hypothetical protein
VELVWPWQPLWLALQLLLVDAEPRPGGPRAVFEPLRLWGPPLPVAELVALPLQLAPPPSQLRVACADDQLDAPATVGAPPVADEPGTFTGGVEDWSWPCWPLLPFRPLPPLRAVLEPPVGVEDTVALSVERAFTSGAIAEASGPLEAAELDTAWQVAPDTPVHEPWPFDPRGCADTAGSVPVAALVTLPVQDAAPWQVKAAPATEAADGPGVSRVAFGVWPSA